MVGHDSMNLPPTSEVLPAPRAVSRQYWLARLPALATGRARLRPDRPGRASQEMTSHRATIPADVGDFVATTSGGNPFLEYCVWAAGLSFLLYRLDPARTVAFASPRRRADHATCGTFVHGIDDLRRQTFRQLLETSRRQLLDDYGHGASPFPTLLSDLALTPGSHDLFDVLLATTRLHAGAEWEGQHANLLVDPESGAIECQFQASRYDESTWRARLGQLWEAMRACERQPDSMLCRLDVLGPAPRARVLVDWNATAQPIPDLCVDQLIDVRAARHPDAPAVQDGVGHGELTYAELAGAAGRLAGRLRAAGVGPERKVGIFGTRHPNLLVAVLATWKAGGAFVPLDAAAAPERTLRTVRAAGLTAVIPLDEAGTPPPGYSGPVIPVDPSPGDNRDSLPPMARYQDELAYVMYTSGSTGTPKGVMVSHRSLANYLLWAADAYGLGPNRRVPVVTSFGYDLTLTTLLASLLVGGTVVVSRGSDDIEALAEVARSTHRPFALLKVTPSHLAAVREAGETAGLAAATDCLVVGGEALRDAHLTQWWSAAGDRVVVNEYGPTEATVGATAWRSAGPSPDGNVPIGHPIANTRVYLLDRDLVPVPDLASGEVYIGGAGLARGYAEQPGPTAAAFLPDPLSVTVGARMYRTGDIARRREDGELEYLDRCDRQVKLSGVRVELGEIEAALCEMPAVRAAAVQLRRDGRDRPVPIAYVVPDGELPPLRVLRRELRQRLPEVAVPSSFVAVEELPLTPGGKVHYDRLPKPDAPARRPAVGAGAPTDRETTLLNIWQDLLGVTVGLHDDFFELGGHSILAIQVVAQAREHGLIIEPSQIFELGTVFRLAQAAEAHAGNGAAARIIEGPVPLTPIQRWFFAANAHDPDQYCQVRSFELSAPVDPARVAQALASVVARHDALRLRFTRSTEGWTQSVGRIGDHSLMTTVDLHGASAERDAAWDLACRDAVQRIRVEGGPLLQAVLGDLGAGRQWLAIAVHHLGVDHVSWFTLVADLERALAGGPDGRPAAPSFVAWSADQPRRATSPQVEATAVFWLAQVEQLGTDGATASDPGVEADSERLMLRLPDEETQRLADDAHTAYNAQLLDVVCAALTAAYQRWDGGSGLWLVLESSGRAAAEQWSGGVGWFTALYPLTLSAGPDPGATLAAVKDRLRAVPDDGSSFGLLRYLHPTWGDRFSSTPEPPVSLNYLGRLDTQPAPASVLRPLAQTSFLARGPNARRGHRLEVSALIVEGALVADFCWNGRHDSRAAVRTLADHFLDELRRLARHCAEHGGPGVTPSDFVHLDLDADELNAVLDEVARTPATADDPR